MDRADVVIIRCDGLVSSGTDDETKVAVGTSTKMSVYGLSIFFSLLLEVLKFFVSWVSADGGQGWILVNRYL